MSNLQFYLAVVFPIFAFLACLAVSLVSISGIRADMREMRSELHADLRDLRTDLKADIGMIRADIRDLTSKVVDIDNRLTRMEAEGR